MCEFVYVHVKNRMPSSLAACRPASVCVLLVACSLRRLISSGVREGCGEGEDCLVCVCVFVEEEKCRCCMIEEGKKQEEEREER